MELHQDTICSPFLRSFQCRLAAIKAVEKSITMERKATKERYLPREIAVAALNSRDHPHLSILHPMLQAGVGVISILPLCLPAVANTDTADKLVLPFVRCVDSIASCSDLHLFSSWSPPPQRPLQKVVISPEAVYSNISAADAAKAVNSNSHDCWSCSSNGGVWAARLPRPSNVRCLTISWMPLSMQSSGSVCGAPQKIVVMVRTAAPGSLFQTLLTIDVDDERKRFKNWQHSYPLLEANDVIEVMLHVSGLAAGNQGTDNTIKMFGVDVFADDTESTWIDMLHIMRELQESLLGLQKLDQLQAHMFSGLLSSARAMGSLSILLSLTSRIHADGLDKAIRRAENAVSFHRLLTSIREEDLRIRSSLVNLSAGTGLGKTHSDIGFDESSKSLEIIISEDGTAIGGTTTGNSYGMLMCEMDSGIWEWEITVSKDTRGDETCCLGVARRPVVDCNYDSTGDMWLVRCYNGDVYHNGRMPKRKSIPHIHPNDVCRFTFDADGQTLSLAVNDNDVGVIFENVDRGVSPAVAFYGSGRKVKLLSIKQLGTVARSSVAIDTDLLLPLTPLPSVDALQCTEPAVHICSALLGVISNLSSSCVMALEYGQNMSWVSSVATKVSKQSLEYPYCIEVSEVVFQSIFQLLRVFMDESGAGPGSQDTTIHLLRILNAQFACLVLSEVDPAVAGLSVCDSRSSLIEEGHGLLRELMSSSRPHGVRRAAAEAFSQGIPLFLSTVGEKIEVAISLIDDVFVSSSPADDSQGIVLKTVMKKLSSCSEVVHMLEHCKQGISCRTAVSTLIKKCLFLTADMFKNPSGHPNSADVAAMIVKYAAEFMSKLQEQLVLDLSNDTDGSAASAWCCDTLVEYCQDLCHYAGDMLQVSYSFELEENDSQSHVSGDVTMVAEELRLGQSIVCTHLLPLAHALCYCLHHLSVVRATAPYFVRVYLQLSDIVSRSRSCRIAQTLVSNSLKRVYQKPSFVEDADTGWRRVTTARFEDADSTFSISDDGMVYTSIQSSNTCAVVTSGFSGPCRAAWEFRLEADATDDECAVFGAAHMPITSRSYSSSGDLYMRRAYNGYLYNRGRTSGVTMAKIHTGDLVRVEFDGRMGTISFGVNGGDQEVAFTDVTGEIFPCCGSYRNSVRVRLVKVEVYGSNASQADIDNDTRSAEVVHWVNDSVIYCSKDPSVLAMAVEAKVDDNVSNLSTWLTCRGDRGAEEGTHAWNIDVVEQSDAAIALGIVIGGNPYNADMLGSPCRAPGNEPTSTRGVPMARPARGNVIVPPLDLTNSMVRTSTSGWVDMVETESYDPDCDYDNTETEPSDRDVDSTLDIIMEEGSSDELATAEVEEIMGVSSRRNLRLRDLSGSITDTMPQLPDLSDMHVAIESFPSSDFPVSRPLLSRTSTPAESPLMRPGMRTNSPNLPASTPPGDYVGQDGESVQLGRMHISNSESPLDRDSVSNEYSYIDNDIVALSWCSDGSLWLNGERKCNMFGEKFLPLPKMSTVRVQVNVEAGTVEYFVNGEYVGVAFGPTGSGSAVVFSYPRKQKGDTPARIICYPAASISAPSQQLRIHASGLNGSAILPAALFTQKTLASMLGRFAACMLAGPRIDKTEVDLSSWMRSPLLSGGLEQSVCNDDSADPGHDWNAPNGSWQAQWMLAKKYVPTADLPWESMPAADIKRDMSNMLPHIRRGPPKYSDADFLNALASAHAFSDGDEVAEGMKRDIRNLLLWLDDINPDPPFLRNGLMKSGTYSFPSCEYPVIACMLKHSSLVAEARKICQFFHVDGYENMKGSPGTEPSHIMVAMWMKIKQLRSTLRRQRQYFLSNPVGDVSDERTNEEAGGSAKAGEAVFNRKYSDLLENVVWYTMPYNVVIRRSVDVDDVTGACDIRVLSLGIRYDRQMLYVKVSVGVTLASQASTEDLPNCLAWLHATIRLPAVLWINGIAVKSRQILEYDEVEAENMWIYLFAVGDANNSTIAFTQDAVNTFDVSLQIGAGESSCCLLLAPQSDIVKRCSPDADIPAPVVPSEGTRGPTFDSFCATITQKAFFLLSVLPYSDMSCDSADTNEIVGCRPDSQSPRTESLLAAQSSSKWLSDDMSDGWKNVTDVLRMQKRLRRDISRESLVSMDTAEEKFMDPKEQVHIESTIYEDIIPVLDLEGSEDDAAPADLENIFHKIMQECALFITSTDDSNDLSLTSLMEVMKRRYQRAHYRSYGMDMLATLLTTPEVSQDSFSIQELLIFVRSSLCMGSSLSSAVGDIPVEYAAPNAHYLSNLEGCSFHSRQLVQSSFLELYASISTLLEKYVDTWTTDVASVPPANVKHTEKVPRSVIGAIFAMLSCWNLFFSGRDHCFLMACSLLPTLHKLVALKTFEIAISNWMGLASRKIELEAIIAKWNRDEEREDWKLWDSEYVQSGLQSGRISCRALLFHLCQAPRSLFDAEERKSLNFPQQDRPFEEICSSYSISQLSLMYEKILAVCRQREENRLRQVEKAQVAYQAAKERQEQELFKKLRDTGVPLFDRGNMCTEVILEEACQVASIRDLHSTCKVASVYVDVTYNFAMDEHLRTGNYFEVTILEAGQKDIGIGLAVLGAFPVSGEMPGWEPHSYGYHGDDGRRFGQRGTTSPWPTWSNGDVIGCGFDVTTRSIFFTYNGSMLGDGFTAVEDNSLRPVVSFHSPNVLMKVRINFGSSPFVYQGEEVFPHPAAAAFAARELMSESALQSAHLVFDSNATVGITAEQVLRMEEEEVVRLLASYGEVAVGELSDLRVSLLAANASHLERYNRCTSQEEKEESEMFETKDDVSDVEAQKISIRREISELDVALYAATSHINELTNLRNYAWALLRYILTTSCGKGGLSEACKPTREDISCDDIDTMPTSSVPLASEKSTFGTPTALTFLDSIVLQESIVAVSMKEVKLGTQYLEIAACGRESNMCVLASHPVKGSSATTPSAPQTLHDTFGTVLSSQTVPLEMCEIDEIMEKHLFAINTLLIYSSSIVDQISTPENLRSLLLIRRIGSPRLQRLAINILIHCLPNISPEVADQSYASRKEFEHLSHKPGGSPRGRVMPDKIVRSLLSRVRAAVAVPSENIWRNFVESQLVSSDSPLSGTHNIPLGYGRLMLWEAGHIVSLVQRLFESPYWTEVISCSLTDSIRNASTIMRNLNAQGGDGSSDLSIDECEVIQMATAACVVFSEVGSLCPGALIMDDNGQVGRVVYNKQGDEDICVVFVNPEAGETGLSYESVVSVPILSIHSIPEGVNIDYSILTQPIIEEILRLMKECLAWFKCNYSHQVPANRSFVVSQIHRLCALLTTSLSFIFEKHSDFVIDCCRDVGFELKDIVETAVIPIALSQLPSLHDLCRMRLFCQARILESGVGCVANTRIKTSEEEPNALTTAEATAPKYDSSAAEAVGIKSPAPPSETVGVLFDDESRSSRLRVATELATQLSLPVQVCLSRLEYFSGDRDRTVRSLMDSSGDTDFDPLPTSIATFSDDNTVRHCDFDVNDTGRPSSDTVACGFRSPYACTVSRLDSATKSAAGASSPELLPSPNVTTGNIICKIDDDGALVASNCNLEVCMSSCKSEITIAMFCDYDLGVDLYHGFRCSDGCVVTHLYETKLEDFPELLLSLDISLTIVRLRQLASRMISDRSINLQRDAGGKEQWLSLLKYIMRGEIMTAGETKDFGKLLTGICDSVMTPSPMAPGGDHIDALRTLMIEDVFWNLNMLMESSTISSCTVRTGHTSPALSTQGFHFASPHPLSVAHKVIYSLEIPKEWRGIRLLMDRRCATAGPQSMLSMFCSNDEKARFQFYGCRENPPAERQDMFASEYAPGVEYLQIKFSHESLKSSLLESVGDSSLCMEISNVVVGHGDCYLYEVTCFRETNLDMSFGIYENTHTASGDRQSRITITSSSCILINGEIISSVGWGSWSSGDTIGCLVDVQAESARVWFGRNGEWLERCTQIEGPNEGFKLFFARNSSSDTFQTNFGESDMLYPPPMGTTTPFPRWKFMTDPIPSDTVESRRVKNWGYSFYVQPLESLAYVVARDFDPIAKTAEEELVYNGRSTMVTLYFWRPKRIAGYKSCGDIVTRENRPPRGAIVVHVDHCTPIKKYTKAFYTPKHDFTVWRPLPPEGYACLGDVVIGGSAKPSAAACSCVPLWALKACGIGGWIFKAKSKATASGKGATMCSIWDVNSYMGYFVGSASERRDFSHKSSDGTVNVMVGYAFKSELLHVIAGEWAIDIDSPSLMWTVHLIDFMLDHPRCREQVLTKDMFTALLRFMSSRYSPDEIAVVPILIKMVRYSFQYGVHIGIESMRPVCKLILTTAYTKCKADKRGGQLPGAVLTLVDLVCEATSHPDSGVVRNAVKTVPFKADQCVQFLSRYRVTLLDSPEGRVAWTDRVVPSFHMQYARLVQPPSEVHALYGKTNALQQLGSIRRFLQYLSSTSVESPVGIDEGINFLPPEAMLLAWYKHLKACVLKESSHPYCDTQSHRYTTQVTFPSARYMYVTVDKRSCLGPNASLKIFNKSGFSLTLRGSDIGEKRNKSIVITGSEVELDFEVVSDGSTGADGSTVPESEYWGWSLVVSADGPVYETSSAVIQLGECVPQQMQGTDENLPDVPMDHPCTAGSAEIDTKEEGPVVETIMEGSPLSEADIVAIQKRGAVVASGTLKVPFAHELKLTLNWNTSFPPTKGKENCTYVVELRSREGE